MADSLALYIQLELLIRRVVAKQIKDGRTESTEVLLEGLTREQTKVAHSPVWN